MGFFCTSKSKLLRQSGTRVEQHETRSVHMFAGVRLVTLFGRRAAADQCACQFGWRSWFSDLLDFPHRVQLSVHLCHHGFAIQAALGTWGLMCSSTGTTPRQPLSISTWRKCTKHCPRSLSTTSPAVTSSLRSPRPVLCPSCSLRALRNVSILYLTSMTRSLSCSIKATDRLGRYSFLKLRSTTHEINHGADLKLVPSGVDWHRFVLLVCKS